MSKYFYTDGTTKFGPFSKEELRNQKISRSTEIWCYGMDNWIELSKIPELNDLISSIPPDIKIENTSVKLNEIRPVLNQTNHKSAAINKNNNNKGKWFVGAVVVLFISFVVYTSIQHQSDVNLYNKIVANSYESDENFEMYMEKFYRDLEYYGIYPKKPKKAIIRLSRLDQLDNTTHIHGLSFGSEDDDKIEIYINTSTWKSFNKPMRYFLMYHELAHDILNVKDLEATSYNKGKLMYPEISTYENKTMDDFIESAHALFEEQSLE